MHNILVGGGEQLLIQNVLYSRKIWRGIKFGSLAVYSITTKLKSTKISYSHNLTVYIHMAIPYRTTKFKYANILAIAILGSTAKNLIPANISSYMVYYRRCNIYYTDDGMLL